MIVVWPPIQNQFTIVNVTNYNSHVMQYICHTVSLFIISSQTWLALKLQNEALLVHSLATVTKKNLSLLRKCTRVLKLAAAHTQIVKGVVIFK